QMTDDAIRRLEDAVRAAPGNTALKRELAAALEAAGRYADALGHLDQLLSAAPADAAALLMQARCLFEGGDYTQALARYARALAIDPGLADTTLRERIVRAQADPRARIRLVADGAQPHHPSAVTPAAVVRPARVTFADVGGLEEIKERIRL